MTLRSGVRYLLLASLGLILLTYAGQSGSQSESAPVSGSIQAAVAQAKREGRSVVTLRGQVGLQPVIRDLEEAVRDFDILVVLVDGQQSYPVDSNTIATWYQCRMGVISRSSLVATGALDIPAGLDGAKANLLLFVSGGSLVIDGVRVIASETGFTQFQTGHRYLLFADIDKTGRAAALYLGSTGVLDLAPDGDSLIPFRGGDGLLREALAQRFANSLSRFRAYLAHPPDAP